MRFTARRAIVLAALLAAAGAVAQDEPQAAFDERVEVNEVLLDVLVTDKAGNVILGLGTDDFLVEDNGEPVALNGATFYSNRRLADSGQVAQRLGIDPDAVPVDRYFILFFHDQRRLIPSLTSEYMELTRRAQDWVFGELSPNDYVAVVRYDAKLMIHQDFTTDNQKIVKALKDVARGKIPSGNWPSRLEDEGPGPSLRANLPQGKELQKKTTRIYSALEVLGEAAGHVIGRKNVMFFSIGFGELNDRGTYIPDARYYGRTMQALNDNNVAVYSVSMLERIVDRGFAATETQTAVADLENGLSLLSSDTGGRFYFNFVNFETPLEQVVEDNGGYYLLSYRSETPRGEGGYRKVSVSTVNPNFVVRAREGYRYGDDRRPAAG